MLLKNVRLPNQAGFWQIGMEHEVISQTVSAVQNFRH